MCSVCYLRSVLDFLGDALSTLQYMRGTIQLETIFCQNHVHVFKILVHNCNHVITVIMNNIVVLMA